MFGAIGNICKAFGLGCKADGVYGFVLFLHRFLHIAQERVRMMQREGMSDVSKYENGYPDHTL